jgi:hypothetical protein
MGKLKTPKMPEHVTRTEAIALWRRVFAAYELDAGGLETLRIATISLDKFLKYSAQIEREGPTFQTESGWIRKNPLAELIKVERMGYLAAMRLLNLQPEPEEKFRPGRPSRFTG